MRKNEKESLINYENSIKKSNELSMAKLNKGLTLNQMQLLAFAIYSTQQSGKTEFHKADFEKKFNIEKYQTIHAKEDAQRLLSLQFSIEDLENNYFEYWNVFGLIKYREGLFTFRWNEEFIPHILELKEKYIISDLRITSNFKSGFSWILYDYLKANYGYWHKPISKDALMRLFGVEDKKTYQHNTSDFKKMVLNVAVREVTEYTEFNVTYKELKKGRSIIGFDLHWSNGTTVASATKKQINELKTIIDAVFDDTFEYVNINNQQARERAIELVRDIERYRAFTVEPIYITKERADFLLVKANAMLRELESMRNRDHGHLPLYNWLEEREATNS